MIDRETIHIHDLSSSEIQAEFPAARTISEAVGVRTDLVTPLLREGIAIGGDSHTPYGGSSLLGQTDRAPQRPSPIKP